MSLAPALLAGMLLGRCQAYLPPALLAGMLLGQCQAYLPPACPACSPSCTSCSEPRQVN